MADTFASISDIVPVKRRGVVLALSVSCIFPFTPYVMYGQLLATQYTWRWGIWICLIFNGVTLVGLVTLYFPKTHPRMEGMSKMDIIKRIDYVGAVLSIVGVTLL